MVDRECGNERKTEKESERKRARERETLRASQCFVARHGNPHNKKNVFSVATVTLNPHFISPLVSIRVSIYVCMYVLHTTTLAPA